MLLSTDVHRLTSDERGRVRREVGHKRGDIRRRAKAPNRRLRASLRRISCLPCGASGGSRGEAHRLHDGTGRLAVAFCADRVKRVR
jgi:hypothetical protein